jgi:prolyl-tRNA synthetase
MAQESGKKKKTAISPIRSEDFALWYQQVVKEANLAENSSTRGCMIILPLGQAIWENIQSILDEEFKSSGHENVYFPLLIPLELLQKEAQHVDGFAKECAVVTHRRLEADSEGNLVPSAKLNSPFVIRPTSEMVIGEAFSRWCKSYRDLPIKINQWANVMRWEMRPRIFLRTAEFLWQEGHTVHETLKEAMDETLDMLKVYKSFLQDILAIKIIDGEKSESEKFPGADKTFTVEALMQDGKALQAGTSHYLGQNFSKAQNIKFIGRDDSETFAFTTSWGVSTRMIGGLIMSHGDDNGLIVPPRIARYHMSIVPIVHKDKDREAVMEYVNSLKAELESQTYHGKKVRVFVDDSSKRGGEKFWADIKKGTPLIAEVGPRDVQKNAVFLTQRTKVGEKSGVDKGELVSQFSEMLDQIQADLFSASEKRYSDNIHDISTKEEFLNLFKEGEDSKELHPIARCFVADNEETLEILNSVKTTIRCYPLDTEVSEEGICIFSGQKATRKGIIGRSY